MVADPALEGQNDAGLSTWLAGEGVGSQRNIMGFNWTAAIVAFLTCFLILTFAYECESNITTEDTTCQAYMRK